MGSWRSAVCSLARADSRRPSQLHRGDVVTLLNQEQLYDRHNFCPGPSPPRYYHSSPLTPNRKQLATQEGAHEFLSSLSPAQRSNLSSALQKIRSLPERELEAPSWKQLRLLCYQNMLPFIGFGFLDNFIMITVADRIEESIGVVLCLSTMAAAGMGNMVSDLAGLGLADQVDSLCRALGIPNPRLSAGQLTHRASRWMALLGRCTGIILGCIIGMCPLLWIHGKDHSHQTGLSSQCNNKD
jgi:hypothetical protein